MSSSSETKSREEKTTSSSSSSSSTKEKLRQQRERLPIFQYREDLLSAVQEKQLLIIIGETGSGKTTQISQFLHEAGYTEKGMIGITQPRRVAAVTVARRVSEEVGCKLGDEVGYTVRFSDRSSSSTKIKYMTDGCLLRECLLDPLLKKYSVIILDEAHERSVHTDILFGLMKITIEKRPDLKVLITSATLDDNKFSVFFNDCPTFFVPGRSFPVDIFYMEKKPKSTSYVETALDSVLQIHEHEGPGDILVFLTGQAEIEDACKRLRKRAQKLLEENPKLDQLLVIPLYAALPPTEQVKVFEPAPYHTRKAILATNIAETSLTVEGIVYVVDPGFVKQKAFNPRTGMESLEVEQISQVAALQRAGRAGRTRPGKCFRLYTKRDYDMLPAVTVPEIQRTNLANIVLCLKALGIQDVLGFQFLDPPDPLLLVQAVKHLYLLGALDADGMITPLGRKMSAFPLDPSFSRMLLASVDLKCSEEMLTIIAMLSIDHLFYKPSDPKQGEEADEIRHQLYIDADQAIDTELTGDPFLMLSLFNTWKTHRRPTTWCKDHYIQPRLLEEADEIRHQLVEIMKKEDLELLSSARDSGTKYERLARAMCSGLFMNSARKVVAAPSARRGHDHQDTFTYLVVKLHTIAHIHPMSGVPLSAKPVPSWIIYGELIASSHIFMRMVCAVKREWVTELLQQRHDVDMNRLLGQNIDHLLNQIVEKDEEPEEKTGKNAPQVELPPAKLARRNDDNSIQAAKERFLQRKKKK